MPMSAVKAIKTYMESAPHGRKVEMEELRALSKQEREELGALCAAELGEELA